MRIALVFIDDLVCETSVADVLPAYRKDIAVVQRADFVLQGAPHHKQLSVLKSRIAVPPGDGLSEPPTMDVEAAADLLRQAFIDGLKGRGKA